MRYDTVELRERVLRMAKVPAGSSYEDIDTLLDVANDEMEDWLVPELLTFTGNHFMAFKDVPLVAGQSRYRFPARAIRPERLAIVDENGRRQGQLTLATGDLVDKVLASTEGVSLGLLGFLPFGESLGLWVQEGNAAVVALQHLNTTGAGWFIRMYFRRQPNQLINTAVCWKVQSVNAPLGRFNVEPINAGEMPGNPSTSAAYDLLKGTPVHETYLEDVTPSAVAGPIFFTTQENAALVSVGDILAPAGYTPVPQLPVAYFGVLLAYVTAGVLREMGNLQASEVWQSKAAEKLQKVMPTATPRSETPPTASQEQWD